MPSSQPPGLQQQTQQQMQQMQQQGNPLAALLAQANRGSAGQQQQQQQQQQQGAMSNLLAQLQLQQQQQQQQQGGQMPSGMSQAEAQQRMQQLQQQLSSNGGLGSQAQSKDPLAALLAGAAAQAGQQQPGQPRLQHPASTDQIAQMLAQLRGPGQQGGGPALPPGLPQQQMPGECVQLWETRRAMSLACNVL